MFKLDPWVRRAAIFLGGQTVSLFGSSVVQFGIGWYITLTTQSGTMLTLSTLFGFLPQLLISLFAGVWADRYNRKLMIVLADGMIATCTAALAVLWAMGYTNVWLLFSISAIRSLGAGIQTPAVSAFLTELVPTEKLMRVNGINASMMSVMMLISPAVAGGLYAAIGVGKMFWVDVSTAVIGIGLLLSLKVVARVREVSQREPFFREMWSGLRYMASTAWLRQMAAFYLFFSIMFGPVIFLTPLMVARSFGPEPWRLMAHEMVFSVGMVIAGVAVSTWGGFRNKVHTLLIFSALFGLTTVIMGFSTNFWFYLTIMFLMGLTTPFINTGSITVIQTRVDPDMLGRVFGLISIISSATMPLSMVIFGPLADRPNVSVELLLIISGALMMAVTAIAVRSKAMLAAGEPLAAEPGAEELAEAE